MKSMKQEYIILDKAFSVIAKEGWIDFSLLRFSKTQKISMKNLKTFFRNKDEILERFTKMIDYKVESNFDFEEMKGTSKKDNLFELIMLRLEAMQPYKVALRNILSSAKERPVILKKLSKNIINSLDFYLEVSSYYDDTFVDFLKKNAIFFIYSLTFRVWLNDESDDLSKTMAELDKFLSMADKANKRITSFFSI
tara:strand:- start:482 stop:1066 length:585 start_codon:yes stop_codon:yes gene_type:complete